VRSSRNVIVAVAVVIAAFGAALAGVEPAAAVPQTVADLYDPSVVRDLRLDLEPLAGWTPAADWTPPEGWSYPEGWDTMTSEQRDVAVAADPVLRPLAVAAAWDVVRFDLTFSSVLPARFVEVVDGVETGTPLRVGVRRKSSRALPSEADPRKVGLKVGFSDFVSGQRWNGVSKISLENGGDISPVHEGMAWQLHQLASVDGFYGAGHDPALAAWSHVRVNGEYLGVYTSVEQRNKQFLRNRGLWTSGSTWLYEQDDIGLPAIDEGPDALPDGTVPNSPTYDRLCFAPFRPTSGSGAATCPVPTDGVLDELLDGAIDMQAMLTEAAVDAFTVNDDALLTHGKNFHFVDRVVDGVDQLRRYYPWDLDAVFRVPARNIYSVSSSTSKRGVTTYGQSPFQTLILNHPVYRARYNQIMVGLLDGPLSAANVDALFARVRPALLAALAQDPYAGLVGVGDPAAHMDDLRTWIRTREATVRSQVAANVPAPRKADATAPVVAAPALSATTVVPDAAVTVTAAVTDNAEITGAEVRVGSGPWTSMVAVDGTFGGTGESVTDVLAAPSLDGIYAVCVRATDSSANTSAGTCTSLRVATPAEPTTIAYTGATSARTGATLALSARLTTAGGTPLAGRTVEFTVDRTTYRATTGDDGVASVTGKAPTKAGSYALSASFVGAVGYAPARATATLTVTR